MDDLSKGSAPNPDNEPATHWATDGKLYKSGDTDAFGVKHILAFEVWSAECTKDLEQKSLEANAKLQASKNIHKHFDMLNAEGSKREEGCWLQRRQDGLGSQGPGRRGQPRGDAEAQDGRARVLPGQDRQRFPGGLPRAGLEALGGDGPPQQQHRGP